jgi:hypothetical protein
MILRLRNFKNIVIEQDVQLLSRIFLNLRKKTVIIMCEI